MRIGILTFHRAINYGAVLQTYALQQTLEAMGHEVWVIDYRQPRVERTDRRPFQSDDKMRLLKGLHLRSWWRYDHAKANVMARRERFDQFLNHYLRLTEPCGQIDIPDFDLYVIGSDQVWNSTICDGLDPVFWGDFRHPMGSKVISYAASTSVKDLLKHKHTELQDLLENFSSISVREQETCDYINQHFKLNNDAITVLDPTLLAEKEIWDSFDNDTFKDQDYVLYFGARACTAYPTILRDKSYSLAKQYGCEVKSIDFNVDSPVDFVNKFRFAKAVVTSSFHGIAFSLTFNRPLYAVMYGDEQDARYVNVLKSFGAENMLFNLNQELNARDFNYKAINDYLYISRNNSIEYLQYI